MHSECDAAIILQHDFVAVSRLIGGPRLATLVLYSLLSADLATVIRIMTLKITRSGISNLQ
jgi:hypothetical protein